MKKKTASSDVYLGDFQIPSAGFEGLPRILKEWKTQEFKKLTELKKAESVNRALLELLDEAKTPCFLLPAVVDYIDQVRRLKILESYTFLHFELWLNQFSGLTPEKNLFIRGKISGKWIPRDAYQALFPIGMGKTYAGSHVVTAHGSPDLDTTVASFWGWLDAFSARVAKRLHLWNVPGGPPIDQTEIELLFQEIFGKNALEYLVKTRTTLGLTGIDLMTQQGMECRALSESLNAIDHKRNENAIVLVDEQGYYVGDWRSIDVEGVREVLSLLNSCLRWLQSHMHTELVLLFSKEKVLAKDLSQVFGRLITMQIGSCEPAQEFSPKQQEYLHVYLRDVLGLKAGSASTFEALAKHMKQLSVDAFSVWIDLLESLPKSAIFDKAGHLIEHRPKLFRVIEKVILGLDHAILAMRSHVEKLSIALKIKTHVFKRCAHSISARAEVEEIRSKMNDYAYLTVTVADDKGNLIPLGIIHASDVYKNTLGTVSLRDFCNREETKIPSYFEVISVIDHHKSQLQTLSAPLAIISDAQSSNVLCAELAFALNDQFSAGNMTVETVEQQLKRAQGDLASDAHKRLAQRLLQRLIATASAQHYFVDPMREYVEYMHFLYAILDDTDLLTKVSIRDLECVASILNRLKSLSLKKEVEILNLSDLPRDEAFTEKAARRILQHRDMYSLYRKIYLAREESIDRNIALCAKGKPSAFFSDTKEQNGCARVGQAKLFVRNRATFEEHAWQVRQNWHAVSCNYYKGKQDVDLYLQMISTVASAEDLYAGSAGNYKHQDEMWLWIPFTEQSIEHLKSFLNAFRTCPEVLHNQMTAEFYGEKAKEYDQIFSESFLPIAKKVIAKKGCPSIAILKFTAGSINSRKAMITPYLPRIM